MVNHLFSKSHCSLSVYRHVTGRLPQGPHAPGEIHFEHYIFNFKWNPFFGLHLWINLEVVTAENILKYSRTFFFYSTDTHAFIIIISLLFTGTIHLRKKCFLARDAEMEMQWCSGGPRELPSAEDGPRQPRVATSRSHSPGDVAFLICEISRNPGSVRIVQLGFSAERRLVRVRQALQSNRVLSVADYTQALKCSWSDRDTQGSLEWHFCGPVGSPAAFISPQKSVCSAHGASTSCHDHPCAPGQTNPPRN